MTSPTRPSPKPSPSPSSAIAVIAIEQIAIEQIAIGERLRGPDPAQIELLADSISRIGLWQPVIVMPATGGDRPYQLICGLQRVEAMRQLGHDTISAVIQQADEARARLAEIDENFTRRDLVALDKASLIATRLAHWEAAFGYSHGGDRRSSAARKSKSHRETLISHDPHKEPETAADQARLTAAIRGVSADLSGRFSESTAESIGLSRASVFRLLSIERKLDPEVARDLRQDGPAKIIDNINQLYRLSRESHAVQRRIADVIIKGDARDVSRALALINGASRPKPDKIARAMTALLALSNAELRELLARAADVLKHRLGINLGEAGNDS